MYSCKRPGAEIRLHYKKYVEIGAIVSLLLVFTLFTASKQFEFEVRDLEIDDVILQNEEIPLTKQERRIPPPTRPTIPVEDPDVDLDDDLAIDDIGEFDFTKEAPPPPPQAIEEEVISFIAVEVAPTINGGASAIYSYLVKHNLYPEMALRSSMPGRVIVDFTVTKEGLPVDVVVFSEDPKGLGFGEAAVQAISAMTFKPGMQRDQTVAVRMKQLIRFRLE